MRGKPNTTQGRAKLPCNLLGEKERIKPERGSRLVTVVEVRFDKVHKAQRGNWGPGKEI